MKEDEKNSESSSQKKYEDAVKEFVNHTIKNPDFFKLSREEQKKLAMETIEKHKNERDKKL